MTSHVYNEGLEVACKASDGKSMAAFPDPCKTPSPPVPVPYPNTVLASDATRCSVRVTIHGKPVMLFGQSLFKTSSGDEAGVAGGLLSGNTKGPGKFLSHSFTMTIEGKPVCRHGDLIGHNLPSGGNGPPNTPPWPFLASMASIQALDGDCAATTASALDKCSADSYRCPDDSAVERAKQDAEQAREKLKSTKAAAHEAQRKGDPEVAVAKQEHRAAIDRLNQAFNEYGDEIAGNDCLAASRCILRPYKPDSCCGGQTGHHLVEASSFTKDRGKKTETRITGSGAYDPNKAPCICAEGESWHQGTHGLLHKFQSAASAKSTAGRPEQTLTMQNGTTATGKTTTYGEARDQGVQAVGKAYPESGCDQACLKAQLDAYHQSPAVGIKDDTPCKAIMTGKKKGREDESGVVLEVRARTQRIIEGRSKSAVQSTF